MSGSKLNPKQAKFCREYLKDLNATEAAKRAGYSEKTAGAQGHALLKNTEIANHLNRAMAKRAKRVEITADNVLTELAKIGFADIRDVMSWKGEVVTIKDSDQLPEHVAKSIQSIKSTTRYSQSGDATTTLEVKLYDKQKALDMIARHLGMFREDDGRNQDDSTIDITPNNIAEIAQRARKALLGSHNVEGSETG